MNRLHTGDNDDEFFDIKEINGVHIIQSIRIQASFHFFFERFVPLLNSDERCFAS